MNKKIKSKFLWLLLGIFTFVLIGCDVSTETDNSYPIESMSSDNISLLYAAETASVSYHPDDKGENFAIIVDNKIVGKCLLNYDEKKVLLTDSTGDKAVRLYEFTESRDDYTGKIFDVSNNESTTEINTFSAHYINNKYEININDNVLSDLNSAVYYKNKLSGITHLFNWDSNTSGTIMKGDIKSVGLEEVLPLVIGKAMIEQIKDNEIR